MNEIATMNPQQQMIATIRSAAYREQLIVALDGEISADFYTRVAVTALLDNPDLVKADPASVYQAFIKAAQDRLLPDGREAALVIFGGKAQYLPMIGGLRKIAAEYGWTIRTAVVYENDRFEQVLGLNPDLIHVPVRPGHDRGKPIAAYAIGFHRDGRKDFEVLDAAEIEKIKKASRASSKGPWVDWWERMWEKSAGRRLFAKLPLGSGDDRVKRVTSEEPDYEESMRALYSPRAPEAPPSPAGSTPPAGTTPAGLDAPSEGTVASHGDEERGATPEAGDAPEQTPSPGSASPEPAFLEESYAAALEEAGLVESPLFEAPASVRNRKQS